MERHTSLKFARRLVVILADVLVLAEVCYAMFVATQTPDELTPVFMRTFLPLVLPTLLAALVASRLIKRRQAAEVPS